MLPWRNAEARLTGIVRRRGAHFQAVTIPNRTLAAVACHFKILRELEAISRAGILAETAEHAARRVISKRSEHFATSGVVAQPADYDQVLRASQGAEIAGNTQRLARLGI